MWAGRMFPNLRAWSWDRGGPAARPFRQSGRVVSNRTDNFYVVLLSREPGYVPLQADADDLCLWAERYRSELATLWLGKELPAWSQPCELKITWSKSSGGGSTGFGFDQGKVRGQSSSMDGRPDCVLNDVMPHEITHMIFAHAFGRPLPRWADEGGSVYAESDRIDDMQIKILEEKRDRVWPLRSLFAMREYPVGGDAVMTMYAESYSVAKYLIEAKDRPTFVRFVDEGMRSGWDQSLQTHYGIASVEQLQTNWQANCFRRKSQPQQRQQAVQQQPRRGGLINVDIGAKQTAVLNPSTLIPPPAVLPTASAPDVFSKLDKAISDLNGMQAKIDSALKNLKDGKDGKDGAPGKDGLAGPAGPRGLPGADGKEGPRGLAGVDGKAGVNGIDGKPGAAGKDGANGKDADLAAVNAAVQDALAKQPPMTCILKDAQGNVINTETFGPNKPLVIRLIPVTPAK